MQDELESRTIQFENQNTATQRVNYETAVSRDGLIPKGSIEILSENDLTTYFSQLKKVAGYPDSEQITKLTELIITDRAIGGSMSSVKTDLKSLFNILHSESHELYNPNLKQRNFINRSFVHLKKMFRKPKSKNSNNAFLTQHPYAYITANDIYGNDTRCSLELTTCKSERDSRYNFDTLFRQVIFRFTDIVALLPASESHHHSYPGGLLAHSLEVANTAYNFAKSQNLKSIGLNDVEILRKKRWQYAAFICGLLHDIGKVITDMVLIGEDLQGNQTKWNPLLSDATTYFREKQIIKYYIDMNSNNKYLDTSGRFKRHENVASVMLYRILTPEAIDYITTSPDTGYGLLEEILNVLNGKSSNEYLKRALFLGESTSVYNSFIKVRSSFHINDHRDSDADMLMSALRDIRHTKEIVSCTYVIGGIVFLKYPETITYLQNHIKRNAIKSTSVNGYSPGELIQRLASSTYIKPASEDVVGLKIQLRKLFHAKNPREPDFMDNYGNLLDVVMLEHPTHMFGNGGVPESLPGTIIINDRHKVIFETEEDCYEIITSKEEYEAAVADKVKSRKVNKKDQALANEDEITKEELSAQKEILKRSEQSKQRRDQKKKLQNALPTSGRIIVHGSVDDINLSEKNTELKNRQLESPEETIFSAEGVHKNEDIEVSNNKASIANNSDLESPSITGEYSDLNMFDRECDDSDFEPNYYIEHEAPFNVNALLDIPVEPVFSHELSLEDLDSGVVIITPATATNKSVTAKGSSGAKDVRKTVPQTQDQKVKSENDHPTRRIASPNLKGLKSLAVNSSSKLTRDICIQQLIETVKADSEIDGNLLSQNGSLILNKNQPLLLASCAFGLISQMNGQTQISDELIKLTISKALSEQSGRVSSTSVKSETTEVELLFIEACNIPAIRKNIVESKLLKKMILKSSHFKDKNLSEEILLKQGLIENNNGDFQVTDKSLKLLDIPVIEHSCNQIETTKVCSTASQSDSVRSDKECLQAQLIIDKAVNQIKSPTENANLKKTRNRKKKVIGMKFHTPVNRTITNYMHEIITVRQKVRVGEFVKVSVADIEQGYVFIDRERMRVLINNTESWETDLIESVCDELFSVFGVENENIQQIKLLIPNEVN
ncbi:hypothetical protein EIJ81_00520 (plasmid) [Aliivibrio salmonicida]|uniref:TraI domain-containing protein n=1 Tax=Aliivibrio salmonicida TaxID=40269 RepID=UPI000F70417F|nr:TraI domain-containing protein [Aliivibrio salmonicida]AZL83383.1 hypothetical protein EIJ81_00520 [Aliivibrio salmonicida]